MMDFQKVSQEKFGFVSQHPTRVYEYAWLLEKMEAGSGNVLEIGAGVSPLPFCLMDMGYEVTTVDSAPPAVEPYNEWGFFDYGDSHNCDFSKYDTGLTFDTIYSISVIEHMTKDKRVMALQRAYDLLKSKGRLLLTVDLHQKTENIWNKNNGVKIEENHGTASDIITEMKLIGFEILDDWIMGEIKGISIDTFYIEAVK